MVLSDSSAIIILSIIVGAIVVIIFFYKRKYNYWKDLGVECMEPTFPFGNGTDIILRKRPISEWFCNYYSYLKDKKVKYGGTYIFCMPTLVAIDLEFIKRIMQTDFVHFTDHASYVNEKDDPLTAHLFALEGQKWRKLRTTLSPIFTSGKMKNMFPIMAETSKELVKIFQKECDKGNPIEGKEISARFTTDIIGSCAFGLECNSLADPNAEFRAQGKRVFNLTAIESFLTFLSIIFPNACRFFGVRPLPKTSTEFFLKVVRDTVDHRRTTGFRRNDALQLLLELKAKDDNEITETGLTFNEIAAQAFVFFIAGFETSSALMAFALTELAINQDIQDKLRMEINTVLEQNEELSYTAIQEMKYLDMVINETLRRYPPLPGLDRVCTKDYPIPDSNIVIKKGTSVFIPIQGIHYDPDYYPNPEKFDPTRFSEENKSKRHQFAFLPFGDGPRVCIGIRFGMMQAKVGLTAVIRNFKVKLNPKVEVPIKLDPKNFLTSPLEDLLFDLEKIN